MTRSIRGRSSAMFQEGSRNSETVLAGFLGVEYSDNGIETLLEEENVITDAKKEGDIEIDNKRFWQDISHHAFQIVDSIDFVNNSGKQQLIEKLLSSIDKYTNNTAHPKDIIKSASEIGKLLQKTVQEKNINHARALMWSLADNELDASIGPRTTTSSKEKKEEHGRPELEFMRCVRYILASPMCTEKDRENIKAFQATFKEDLNKGQLKNQKPKVYSNIQYVVGELDSIIKPEKPALLRTVGKKY